MASGVSPGRTGSGPAEASTSTSAIRRTIVNSRAELLPGRSILQSGRTTEVEPLEAFGFGQRGTIIAARVNPNSTSPPRFLHEWHPIDEVNAQRRISSFERRRREEEAHEFAYDELFDHFVNERLPSDREQPSADLNFSLDEVDEDDFDGEQPMDWRAEDAESSEDDDEGHLRLAMNEFARQADQGADQPDEFTLDQLINLSSPYEADEPTPSIFAQRLADRRAAAASRSLRDLYGSNYPEPWPMSNQTYRSRYIGSRPLNEPEFGDEARPSVTRPSMSEWLEERQARMSAYTDPSSATSSSLFLSPGMVLKGEQVFIDRKFANSPPPSTAPLPPLGRRDRAGFRSSEWLARNAELRGASERRQRTSAAAYESLFSANVPNPTRSAETARAEQNDADNAAALERLLVALRDEDVLPTTAAPSSNFASRLRALERARTGPGSGGQPERWSVSVTIQACEPAASSLSGVMYALGINDAAAPTVTTHFIGQILNPAVDGLWTTASAKTLPLTDWGIRRAAQAGRHWAGMGPFEDVSKEELTTRMRDLKWLRRKTQGWVLMRWKETGFVNVRPKDSSLSIAGFYHCALNRQTGQIDGLYFDPVASPHQRLTLNPATGGGVPFALESFDLR